MKPTSQELEAWDRGVLWHAFTQMAEHVPLIIERAEGCRLYDRDGRSYLDAVSNLWCNIHGHARPEINAAVRAQLERVAHVTLLGAASPPAIELAARLARLAPPGLNHVFFSSDGASSIEAALKMAFQYWRQCDRPRPEKTRFAALCDAYHGDTLGSTSVSGVDRFNAMFKPLLFDVERIAMPDTYRLPAGVTLSSACDHYLRLAEQTLELRHESLAALIVEPIVQCAAGMVMHPPGFLAGLRKLTRKYDVLLIADEVAVGFGRTGTMFACERESVSPDLMCLAKGLTGGYLPMSATLATDEIYNAFLGDYGSHRTFYHGHTYAGNALAAAAALATLDLFETDHTLDRLPEKAGRLGAALSSLPRHPHVGDVRQRGMIAAVELVQNKTDDAPFPYAERRGMAVCDTARRHGVLLRAIGNVIEVMPPLCVSHNEIDEIAAALEKSLTQLGL